MRNILSTSTRELQSSLFSLQHTEMGLIPSAQSMKPEIKVDIMQNLDCFFLLVSKRSNLWDKTQGGF